MVRVDKRKESQPDAAAIHNQRFHASTKPTVQQRQLNGQLSTAADQRVLAILIRENIEKMNSV